MTKQQNFKLFYNKLLKKELFKKLVAKAKKVKNDPYILIAKTKSSISYLKEKSYQKINRSRIFLKENINPKIFQYKKYLKNKSSPYVLLIKSYWDRKLASKFKKNIIERILKISDSTKVINPEIVTDEQDKDGNSLSSNEPFQEWTDHSASLSQGKHWSSAIITLCSAMFVGSLMWAFTARIDQTITVRGRLQPSGAVREVESPSAGVVSMVYIKDGDVVKSGQPLFIVEAKGLASKREGISSTLAILDVQAASLRAIMNAKGDSSKIISMPELPVIDDPDLLSKLVIAQQQSELILSQLSQIGFRLDSRKKTLKLQQEIAENLKPLYEVGAIARNQYLTKLNQVQEVRADVQTLQQERTRILGQAAVQLNQINTEMINLRSQLVEIGETLEYRTVKAPIDGKIFDTKVSPYSVVGGGSLVLKIVPDNRLEAAVKISNKDIGFVKTGMSVNVSVDSFPSGEFGYLEGTLKTVGSDALPPTNDSPGYNFPATISLKQQEVESGGKQLNLQSGMGVNANIKLRSRPVISLLTDLFTKQIEGVSRFR